MGFRVWGCGFGVEGLGFGVRVWGLGFGAWGLGFGVWGLGGVKTLCNAFADQRGCWVEIPEVQVTGCTHSVTTALLVRSLSYT